MTNALVLKCTTRKNANVKVLEFYVISSAIMVILVKINNSLIIYIFNIHLYF